MATKKKMLEAAAGGAGGAGLDITDVFSTYLYTSDGAPRTITNGIDLGGEGGLVWIKGRGAAVDHALSDTENSGKYLRSNSTDAIRTYSRGVTSFNSDGFSLGDDIVYDAFNTTYANPFVSWTFRKSEKFFTCLTYTGNGTAGTQIAHDLGSVPGMMIFKKTSAADGWAVYHRGANGGTDPEDYRLELNENFAQSNRDGFLFDTAPTATHFTVGDGALSNTNGETYVAYLFAHNDGDGTFGPDGDQDIIKCGSYTGTGATGTEVNLGWEPQYVLIKNTTSGSTENWGIFDTMRGMPVGSADNILYANTSNAEATTLQRISLTATGFILTGNAGISNQSGHTYIYMAIRRGPLAPPEAGTEVFAMDTRGAGTPDFTAGFSVDMSLFKDIANGSSSWTNSARLIQGLRLIPNTSDIQAASSFYDFDYQSGWGDSANGADTNDQTWMWKRAPSFFDVVCYTGDGTLNQTFSHGLAAKPDMVWIKNRGRSQSGDWWVGLDDSIVNLDGRLNSSGDFGYSVIGTFTDTTVQTLSQNQYATNYSGDTYIAYLFATVAGVSKVGSYTGTGTHDTHVIDCGFTTGARFVLLKRTDATSDWFLWDSVRGITNTADPRLSLNTTAAEYNGLDDIRPDPSGFIAANPNGSDVNANGSEWIFYAIA